MFLDAGLPALLLALAAAGCSGGDDVGGVDGSQGGLGAAALTPLSERAAESSFRRLDFQAEAVGSRGDVDLEPKILVRQGLIAQQSPWEAMSPGGTRVRGIFETAKLEKRIPGFEISGLKEKKWIQGAIPPEAAGFSKVVFEMTVLGGNQDNATLELLKGGRPVLPAPVKVVEHNRAVQVVSFSVPEVRQLAEEPDAFRLVFKGNSKLAVIVSVSFIEVPFETFLMPDEGMGEAVLAGAFYRRAEHLTTDAASSAALTLDQGEEIALFLGVDPRVARPGEALSFDVAATVGEKTATRRVEAEVRDGWLPVRFTADELGSGEAKVEIRTSSNVEAGIGVGLVAEGSVRNPGLGASDALLPVVLLITSDTHRADHLGILNADSPVETPHLDALARRGVLFENCYSQTNVTNPSHIGLMTGMHPRDTGILDNRTRLSVQASTLAEQFASEGYETFASTSAFHLLDVHSGLGQGFDRMEGPLIYQRDGEVAIETLESWLEASGDAPVFAWLHLFDAHEPYGPPKPFDRKYYPDDVDPFHGERPEGKPETLFVGAHARLKDMGFPEAQYRAEVDYLDGALHSILQHPRIKGGVTAFTADHGEAFGQHGIWWDHAGLYPDTVHIPLILAWPGGPAGERTDAPVRQIDLGRTLLDLAGIEHREFSGRSLQWALDTPEATNPRFMLASHSLTASIEVDGWHMVMELRRNKPRAYEWMRATGEVELYHRAVDPLCEKDVLMENLPRAKAMRAKLIDWLNGGPVGGLGESQSRSAGDEAMLAALGYGGDDASSDSAKHWDPLRWEKNTWADSKWRTLFED